MSHVSVGWVLEQVDLLTPNQYTDEQKRHWLHQAEAFVVRQGGSGEEVGELADEQELTAQVPYDNLYRHYVEAQIHYANGEMSRYNNAMAAWNELLLAWRDACSRGRTGRQGAAALKLC